VAHRGAQRGSERSLLQNVVSFEMPISRMEGKFKLNRGEQPERTRAAIAQLEQRGEKALADYMRLYNEPEP
jgi:predicted FMN-binding regulatory protein PaiB